MQEMELGLLAKFQDQDDQDHRNDCDLNCLFDDSKDKLHANGLTVKCFILNDVMNFVTKKNSSHTILLKFVPFLQCFFLNVIRGNATNAAIFKNIFFLLSVIPIKGLKPTMR